VTPKPRRLRLLALVGIHDRLTLPAGTDRDMSAASQRERVPENRRLSRHPCGYLETAAMRQEAFAFLREWLQLKWPSPPASDRPRITTCDHERSDPDLAAHVITLRKCCSTPHMAHRCRRKTVRGQLGWRMSSPYIPNAAGTPNLRLKQRCKS
jgi:hypothetical protein